MAAIRIAEAGTGIGNRFPLSESVHFSLCSAGKEARELNDGYGMLFASSVILEDNTISERLVKHPGFVHAQEGWGIAGIRVDLDGNETDEGKLILWTTKDFIDFDECGMADCAMFPEYDPENPVLSADISDELAEKLEKRWLAEPTGEEPMFPLAPGYADPVLKYWHGDWYFIATNDNTNDVGLFIRKASTMEGLFAEDTKEYCILDKNEELDFVQTFWAPELHEIGGRLYILLALGGKVWAPQCHMMRLKENGDPVCAQDWETPVRVQLSNGEPLTQVGISLDMTYIHAASGSYLAWSYREGIRSPLDSGSMLMIARIRDEEPWKLISDPVLLSRPLYAWENRRRTINNEGPYPLYVGDDIYLTYSAGAAGGESYAVGYLLASGKEDLTDVSNWKKSPMPVLHSLRVPNVYGPGHNALFTDEKGDTWIVYHAQKGDGVRGRCTSIHRIYFAEDGSPIFDLRKR